MNKFFTYRLAGMFMLAVMLITCKDEEEFVPLKIFSVAPAEVLLGNTGVIHGEGFNPGLEFNQILEYFRNTARSFRRKHS